MSTEQSYDIYILLLIASSISYLIYLLAKKKIKNTPCTFRVLPCLMCFVCVGFSVCVCLGAPLIQPPCFQLPHVLVCHLSVVTCSSCSPLPIYCALFPSCIASLLYIVLLCFSLLLIVCSVLLSKILVVLPANSGLVLFSLLSLCILAVV